MMKYYFIIISLVLISCNKEKKLSSSTIQVKAYKNIEILSAFDVTLVEDSIFKVEVKAPSSKGIEKIDVKVNDSTLFIQDERTFKWLQPSEKISLVLHSPKFSEMKLYGGVKLSNVDTLKSKEIGVIFSGKGNICNLKIYNNVFYFWNEGLHGGGLTLSGETDQLKLWYQQLVHIDAFKLKSKSALIETKSMLDCEVNVSQKVDFEILSTGNILCKGNPTQVINREGNGEGSFILVE